MQCLPAVKQTHVEAATLKVLLCSSLTTNIVYCKASTFLLFHCCLAV